MKIVLLSFLFSGVVSCTNNITTKKTDETPNGDTSKYSIRTYFDYEYKDTSLTEFPGEADTLNLYYNLLDFFHDPYDVTRKPEAKDIPFTARRSLRLPEHFTQEEILIPLFGDELFYARFENYADSVPVAWWTCSSCKQDSIPYMGHYAYGTDFPGKDFNSTLILSDYAFEMNIKRYRLINLITYPDEFGVEFTGRFNAPVAGYALFEWDGVHFVLKDFNPAVGTYGSYNYPHEPEIRIAFDQFFIIYECFNGGAGAPYTSRVDVFSYTNGRMQKVAAETFLSCDNNAMGKRQTQYHFYKEGNEKYAGLKMLTTGYFVGLGETTPETYPYVFEGAPLEFMNAVKNADDKDAFFSFVYERKFQFGRPKEENITFRKLQGKWKTERVKAD